jgi:UDP-2,3-diacylglucosamine pyrophosphatase LpxH
MHAIMRISSTGEIQLLDQLSEHGTKVKRANGGQVDELSGDKALVYHGDTIFFGKRSFHVCMVSRS